MKIEDLLMYQTDVLMLPAGKTLFSEGEEGDSMYAVVSGKANIMVRGKVLETAGIGTIFGEMALIDNSPRSATVVAVEDCSLIAINAARFSALTREVPDFALHVMRAMADRLRHAGKSQ
jgi:CRP-like cAMP-binding protein